MTGPDAAAVAKVHMAYDDAAACSAPTAETNLSEQGEQKVVAAVSTGCSDAEPCSRTVSGSSYAAHDIDGQAEADREDTHVGAEPGDAISVGGNDSTAEVQTAAEAEPLAMHEDAASVSVSSWPEEQLNGFQSDDGDYDGLDPSAGVADMDESRPPSRVVSPQQSFSWRQLPEPDFWGPARSGPVDMSQHALGALPTCTAWQFDAVRNRGASDSHIAHGCNCIGKSAGGRVSRVPQHVERAILSFHLHHCRKGIRIGIIVPAAVELRVSVIQAPRCWRSGRRWRGRRGSCWSGCTRAWRCTRPGCGTQKRGPPRAAPGAFRHCTVVHMCATFHAVAPASARLPEYEIKALHHKIADKLHDQVRHTWSLKHSMRQDPAC